MKYYFTGTENIYIIFSSAEKPLSPVGEKSTT